MNQILNYDMIMQLCKDVNEIPYRINAIILTTHIFVNGEPKSATNIIYRGNYIELSKRDRLIMLANYIKVLRLTKEDLLNPLG